MSAAGRWLNGYGSVMFLDVGDGGALAGVYTSTTGATGAYWIAGFAASGTSQSLGAPLSFSILWRSFSGGSPDASWHWVSGFSGQMQPLDPVNNGATLILFNDLVATAALPPLASAPGSYIDKLAYVPYTGGATSPGQWPPPFTTPASGDAIDGKWQCIENPSIALSLALQDITSGYVSGTLITADGECPVVGFTDNGAGASGVPLQGVTLSALLPSGQATVAIAGNLVLASDTISVEWVQSAGTPSSSTYMQTTIQGLNFTRG